MNDERQTVDERFRRWRAASAPDEAHLRALTARIVQEVGRRRRVGAARMAWRAAWLAPLAAAAAVAVCVWIGRVWPPAGGVRPAAPGPIAAVTERSASAERFLYEELNRLFAGRFRWAAESNGAVTLGVSDQAVVRDVRDPALAVRFVVVARAAGDTAWRPVWSRNVLIGANEIAQIAADADAAGESLTLWTHPLADGKIAVEADLRLDALMPVQSSIRAVLSDGKPAEVASFRADGIEYSVVQTVRVL